MKSDGPHTRELSLPLSEYADSTTLGERAQIAYELACSERLLEKVIAGEMYFDMAHDDSLTYEEKEQTVGWARSIWQGVQEAASPTSSDTLRARFNMVTAGIKEFLLLRGELPSPDLINRTYVDVLLTGQTAALAFANAPDSKVERRRDLVGIINELSVQALLLRMARAVPGFIPVKSILTEDMGVKPVRGRKRTGFDVAVIKAGESGLELSAKAQVKSKHGQRGDTTYDGVPVIYVRHDLTLGHEPTLSPGAILEECLSEHRGREDFRPRLDARTRKVLNIMYPRE